MHALIIANGTVPSRRLVRKLASTADIVVCADGGANIARRLHIRPDVIVGDFDSMAPATKKFFREIPQLATPDQNSTDMEKALQYCVERRITSADVVGALGGRVDHTLGNLGCFKRFGRRLHLRFVDSFAELFLVQQSIRISVNRGDELSLIPLDRCTGISTTNLKYSLHNDLLETGIRDGISNVATARTVGVRVRHGTLLVYRIRNKT